jgi:tetratricopeptide (TPR) repeat protein
LKARGDLDGAIGAFRRATELDPKDAFAFANLGVVLRLRGRLAESVAAFRQGAQLLPEHAGLKRDLQLSQRWLELQGRVTSLLQGKGPAPDPGEAVAIAQFSMQPFNRHFRLAHQLFQDAFAADPKLVGPHSYDAACAALRLADGADPSHPVGMDGRDPLRQQALRWLTALLQEQRRLLAGDKPEVRALVDKRLAHWQGDADLASVRDPRRLAELPEGQRRPWQAFWKDVEALRQELREK